MAKESLNGSVHSLESPDTVGLTHWEKGQVWKVRVRFSEDNS